MAKMRKVTVVQRLRRASSTRTTWRSRNHRHGQDKTGKTQTIRFKQAIIAAGSQAVKLPFLPRTTRASSTSTGALELRQRPKRMLIIGGGIIGLEMGTVYSTLGARLDVVEMLDGLMQGADRDLVKVWQKMNAPRFDNIMLKTKTVGAEATADGILRDASKARARRRSRSSTTWCCRPWAAAPNGKKIGADKAGVAVSDRGFIPVDVQMRTNVPHIFAIGDIVGQPMLAHKAVHEAHVAAEVAGAATSKAHVRRARDPERGLHRPRGGLGRPDRGRGQGPGHQGQEGPVPVDGFGPRHRQRPRRRLHQAAVRRRDAPHPRRRHRRHACRRHDRRGRAGHRDGRRRGGHRQDHPPAPDAGREHRHGGRGGARQLHRPAARQRK